MNIAFTDDQTIGETDQQAFQIYQQGPVNSLVTMSNQGVNPIVYHYQQFVGGTWSDISAVGTPLNSTLTPGQAVSVSVASASNQVALLASASGGSLLTFSALQYAVRVSGGAIPILNF